MNRSSSRRRLVAGRWLRCGHTTGSCAAAAAGAATTMLATGQAPAQVAIDIPHGASLTLDVAEARWPAVGAEGRTAACAVRKDGGDDPDATDGALIFATVARRPDDAIVIDGGDGVGRVTRPGLDQPVGAAAINSVPRAMIEAAVRRAATEAGAAGGWEVRISCPEGHQIARHTFNPKLGVVGGISILGTTGIVEPMSNAALIETTAREIAILAASGLRDLLVVVGNYGESFARRNLGLAPDGAGRHGQIKSSNFIGDAVAQAAGQGFERLLVVGHLGKLAKLGIGMLNTHSSVGDGRIETLVMCALRAGADLELLRQLAGCVSTDAATDLLSTAGLLEATMAVLAERIQETFDRHVPAGLELEVRKNILRRILTS